MLIAHLSDTHVSAPGQKTCGVAQMAENLVRCVENINALDPRPDIVVLSGDVTNAATCAEARHAADILSSLAMPLFIVPGNHDDRKTLCDVFGDEICPANPQGFVDYVVEGYPLRIIALDTLAPGKPGGRVEGTRLDWLRDRLEEGDNLPTLLFAHHPPLKLGVPETDEDGFEGASRLRDIVSSHPNIERFLCGHIHLHTTSRWCGTVVTTAPSTGMQLTLDLKQKGASRFLLSDPGYLLHHWTPDRVLITHPILLTELEGPFDFSG